MRCEDISSLIKGECQQDQLTLEKYSVDASIFKIKPEGVIFPKDIEDIKKLVLWATKKKKNAQAVSLTARSAGSDMSGGPLNESIIVDVTRHLNQIKEIGSDYAVVEPGVYFRDLEEKLNQKNLFYPAYPASKQLAALGGMIANNAGGEKSLKYGKTEKYILRLKVVLADGKEYLFEPITKNILEQKISQNDFEGKIYKKTFELIKKNLTLIEKSKPKVSKNSAGYNIWNIWDKQKEIFNLGQLFVGSQGTLGIITEAKLKVLPKKRHQRLMVVFLKDLEIIPQIVSRVLQYSPESFESYDRYTFEVALKFLPSIFKKMKGSALILGLRFLPEIWRVLIKGLPAMVLLIEFAADKEEEISKKMSALKDDLVKLNLEVKLTKTEAEAEKYWVMRRESFNLLRQHIKGKHTAPFIDDIIIDPKFIPEFLPKLNLILKNYPDLIYTIAGHIGNGNFHIIPLMNLEDENQRKIIPELSEKVYDLVISYGGSITAEHNDGLIRSPFLVKMFGKEMCQVFQEIKNIFDPLNIFNPGKKVGSSLKYALDHIIK